MSHRNWSPFSGYSAPLGYFRGVPVYLTTILVVIHVVALLATAGVQGFGTKTDVLEWQRLVGFTSNFWETGRFWTPLTYLFYHNIVSEHIFFAVELVLFYWFGHEVEKHLGRIRFAVLYGLLALIPPLALVAVKDWLGVSGLVGSRFLHFGVFISFVAVYPQTLFFGAIPAKWVAWVLLFISTVYIVVVHSWEQLIQLWLVTLTAVLFVRSGIGVVEWVDSWRMEYAERKMKARVAAHQMKVKREEESVDAVLEKISREGLASLSDTERLVLERASRKLAQEERRR